MKECQDDTRQSHLYIVVHADYYLYDWKRNEVFIKVKVKYNSEITSKWASFSFITLVGMRSPISEKKYGL
jgi:hypothetical protein